MCAILLYIFIFYILVRNSHIYIYIYIYIYICLNKKVRKTKYTSTTFICSLIAGICNYCTFSYLADNAFTLEYEEGYIQGYFQSTNYPDKYPTGENKDWSLSVDTSVYRYVQLTFYRFQVHIHITSAEIKTKL